LGNGTYDHHSKAGNRGDVVKHVALVASLTSTLEQFDGRLFRYADTYAGYAWNPLKLSQGWRDGIRDIAARIRQRLAQDEPIDRHVRWWYDRYLASEESLDESKGLYPGSSMIANDVLAEWSSPEATSPQYSLSLWDTSQVVVDDLTESLTHTSQHIFHRPAKPNERAILEANFLFIDPPYLSDWPQILHFLKNRPKKQSILVWLPICSGSTANNITVTECRDQALALNGFAATEVRWQEDAGLSGCLLLHSPGRVAIDRLRASANALAQLTVWTTVE